MSLRLVLPLTLSFPSKASRAATAAAAAAAAAAQSDTPLPPHSVCFPLAMAEKYYSWGHRFGGNGCSRRIEESISQSAELIAPEQDQLFLWIHEYAYTGGGGVTVVCGAPGVGKSALVRFWYYPSMAYSLKLIKETELHKTTLGYRWAFTFERHGWVDVPEPFDLAEFSRRLLLDFNSYDPGEMEKTAVGIIQGHNPIQRCYEIIRKHKCKVVIDGLRSTRDWDSIKQAFFCHHHKESCILVISTDESVAKHCTTKFLGGPQRIIHIKALDDTSALELFTKVVDHQNAKRDNWEKEASKWSTEQKLKHADGIVPKCGGLPKVIDAVAKSDYTFWWNINDDLVTKLNGPQFGHLRGIFSWMHSYFDGCSDLVKPCVFYLSVFPTNYKIRKAHLLRRWITEGYCRDTTSSTAKKNAESVFDELVELGIIQELPGMPLCQISGFFREYITSQPMEDNLVFVLEGHRKPNTQRTVQHLTIMEDWEREQFESIDVSRLRSLTVYGEWKQFFISDKIKRIRVLDLEGTSGLGDVELKGIFGILLSLKFISLRRCKSITCLPETLGGLRLLESLDVRGTSIVTLPPAITKLQKIQYIRAGMFLPDEDYTSAASGTTPTPAEAKDGGIEDTSPPQATISQDTEADSARQDILPPEADGGIVAISSPQPLMPQDKRQKTSRLSYSMLRAPRLPCSWYTRMRSAHNIIMRDGGVEVPVGIENMPALHTLGTVNISSAHGMDFLRRLKLKAEKLKEAEKLKTELPRQIEDMPSSHTLGTDFLTKLKLKTTLPQITTPPQLLKLSVCGINKGNWKDLCDAVSALHRLESLSLGLDEDFREDSCFNNPPMALKRLRLYGRIHKSPAWPWSLVSLKKFDLEVIISCQSDMDQLVGSLPRTGILRRLCIKPIREKSKESKLEIKRGALRDPPIIRDSETSKRVLKIDCSSALEVDFQWGSIGSYVSVLIIHCTKGSDFRISSGLEHLGYLDTVWLQGYDEKAEYVADLKKQVAEHGNKPVFKFERLE